MTIEIDREKLIAYVKENEDAFGSAAVYLIEKYLNENQIIK